MSMELIKKIRERTGAGIVVIKKALDEAQGNEEKAIEILRKQGESKAAKKAAEREAHEGIVMSYVHSNNRVAALVKLYCETDFVARNSEFQELAKDIAMHVVAMSPKFIKPEEVSEEALAGEKEIWRAQLEKEGKSAEMIEKIMLGKEKKFREESALLTQSFVKNPELTVGELIVEKIAKIGEKIEIGEISRIEL